MQIGADNVGEKAEPSAVFGHGPVEGASAVANVKEHPRLPGSQNVRTEVPRGVLGVGLGEERVVVEGSGVAIGEGGLPPAESTSTLQ